MRRVACVATILTALMVSVAGADKIDPRLSTIRKAFVVAADDLSDDRSITSCFVERLPQKTPVEIVKSKEEADAILTISKGSVGKHPKAEIDAALPDGTPLWHGGSKTRGFNLVGRNMTCVIADDLVGNLRDAMKKARGK